MTPARVLAWLRYLSFRCVDCGCVQIRPRGLCFDCYWARVFGASDLSAALAKGDAK